MFDWIGDYIGWLSEDGWSFGAFIALGLTAGVALLVVLLLVAGVGWLLTAAAHSTADGYRYGRGGAEAVTAGREGRRQRREESRAAFDEMNRTRAAEKAARAERSAASD